MLPGDARVWVLLWRQDGLLALIVAWDRQSHFVLLVVASTAAPSKSHKFRGLAVVLVLLLVCCLSDRSRSERVAFLSNFDQWLQDWDGACADYCVSFGAAMM